MPRKTRPAPISPFQAGDRVTERLSSNAILYTPRHPDAATLRRYATKPRTGAVVAIHQKSGSRGQRMFYADVLWDGHQSPSTHAINRLAPLST